VRGAEQLAAADPAGVRKVGDVLPARMRGNGWAVARAAGQLSSRPLGRYVSVPCLTGEVPPMKAIEFMIATSGHMALIAALASCRALAPVFPQPTATPPRLATRTAPTIEVSPTSSRTPPPAASATPSPAAPVALLRTFPPGQYIVYAMIDSVDEYGWPYASLFVSSLEGDRLGRLAANVAEDARISPDQRWIAFLQPLVPGVSYELSLLDVSSGQIIAVPGELDCGPVTWSPDGQMLAATCGSYPRQLEVLTLADGNATVLTVWSEPDEDWAFPAWSPDGHWIAVRQHTGGQVADPRNGLYLVNSECRLIPTSCREQARGPFRLFGHMSWSPDSRFLATIEGSSIAILDIATGRARTVSMLPELVTIQAVAWSPDGTWIAFSGGRPGTAIDIYLIRPEGGDPVPVLTDRRDKYVTFWLSVP